MATFFGCAFGVILLSGCDEKKEAPLPVPVEERPSPAAQPVDPHASAQVPSGSSATEVGIMWDVPEGFQEMPPRPMRKATYQVAGPSGPAEVAVFYFGVGQGGDVESNFQRWVGQFQDLPPDAAKRSEGEENGLRHFNIEVEKGTFSSGMPGAPATPQADFAMSATIVQAKSGQYFFKMTGPAATLAAQKSAFQTLLKSVREKQ